MAGNITRLPTMFNYTPSITHTDMGEREEGMWKGWRHCIGFLLLQSNILNTKCHIASGCYCF